MQLRVLYLDDEPALCAIFFDEFSSEDIHVVTFTDPQKAIEAAIRNSHDIIFLDNRLPGINGDEVAKAMPPAVPKYLITGDSTVRTSYKFIEVLQPFL